ncbi:hypothetical protein NMG60_11003203 [Bertholletia excelsa]
MKTLMFVTPTRHLGSQFPSLNVIFNFASLSPENRNLFRFSHRRWFCHPRTLSFCSSATSESVSYGGWDDPRLRGALGQPGDSTQLRNFLNSLGIDDKRYVFTYLLGFVCALAISRVRVSSIILFPACAIVFAVGFSIGIVNGGHVNELTLTGAKKRSKDEALSVSTEKLRNLLDLFAGIDGKIGNLKSDISRRIESNRITRGDLESYVKAMESIGLSFLNARSVVEACVNSISIETQELERNINQKSGRRKKLGGENGFDLLQFIRGFFQESSVGSKPNKVKDCVKRDPTQVQVNDQSGGNIFASAVAEKSLSPVSSGHTGKGAPSSYGDIYNEPTVGWDGIKGLANGARRVNGFVQDDKMSFSNSESQDKRELDSKHHSHQTNRSWFMDNQQFSLKMDRHSEFAKRTSHSNLLESMDFSINLKHTETEASFKKEQILHKNNGTYRETSEREFYKPQERGERIFSEDNPCLADDLNGHKSDAGNSSSSTVSDDNMFNLYLVEAKSLLKEARECLKISCDEDRAETLLYNSAKLLSRAIDLKPMSLLAVGQLGNTYLLHGELKLKISRQLRARLTNSVECQLISKVKYTKSKIMRMLAKMKLHQL